MSKLFKKYASINVKGFDSLMREEDFEIIENSFKAKIKLLWIIIAIFFLWSILAICKW